MKILSIGSCSLNSKKVENKAAQAPKNLECENKSFNYPKGFTPYFGARLHRTPENFFSQEFNLQNMPDTVKKYLMSDFETNKQKSPATVQKEAFADLEMCESVEDVKEMFPEEPLFNDLKTLNTLRSPSGYLYELRYLCDKNNKNALKSGEDLTVYLLKKIYLEGKDLKEINEDFKKDVKEELLDPEKFPNEYFQYSTLKSMGVNFPNHAYWNSFQATREDKEYIPYTVTIDPNRVRKPREYKPRVISSEERQRRSERMVNRWLEMSPAQREKQIEKMRAGAVEGVNNTLFEYLSPIMIIAADKANLSEKMVEFFNKNSSIDDCPNDLSTLSKSQHEKLKKFWDENPKMKERFSTAIVSTIREFDEAKAIGENMVNVLINISSAIKTKNEIRAIERKLSNPELLKQFIYKKIYDQNQFYPDFYVKNYAEFVKNHKLFKSQILPLCKNLILNGDQSNKKSIEDLINKIHDEYMRNNKKLVIASNIAVAYVANRHINDVSLYTSNPAGIINSIERSGHAEAIVQEKPLIEQITSNLSEDLSPQEINNATKMIITRMQYALENGYSTLTDFEVIERGKKDLPKVYKAVSKNKHERNKLKDILKDYTAYLRFCLYPTIPNVLKTYMIEALIDECVLNFDLKK